MQFLEIHTPRGGVAAQQQIMGEFDSTEFSSTRKYLLLDAVAHGYLKKETEWNTLMYPGFSLPIAASQPAGSVMENIIGLDLSTPAYMEEKGDYIHRLLLIY